MKRFLEKKKYSVEDIDSIIPHNTKQQYEVRDIAELVSYVLPAYSQAEITSILLTSFKVTKRALVKHHKNVRFNPLCIFKTEKYFEGSKRWSYDLVPTLSTSDKGGKVYL